MKGYLWSKYGVPKKITKIGPRESRKIIKVHFHLLVVVVVVVVVVLLQFQLAYLNNQTVLRDETLRTDRYP